MIPSLQPIRIPSRFEHDAHGGRLIQRVLGRDGTPDARTSAVVELDGDERMPIRAAFVDATGGRPPRAGPGATAFHVLWCRDEPTAVVHAGMDHGDELIPYPIAPGDTLYVPPCRPFAVGPGILGYEVSSVTATREAGPDVRQPLPSHGLERFEGYNRRTVCAAGPELVLERWKVTQPLTLPLPADRPLFVTNLVEPMAIVWHGGSDLIGRAESRLLPPGLRSCTLIPDGLGYLLVSHVPERIEDVVGPLRAAGHDDAAIAALGELDTERYGGYQT